ncbi:MAG: PEPxxWA-CTERM sorting domain-containing protein [Novosphingobium sp.]
MTAKGNFPNKRGKSDKPLIPAIPPLFAASGKRSAVQLGWLSLHRPCQSPYFTDEPWPLTPRIRAEHAILCQISTHNCDSTKKGVYLVPMLVNHVLAALQRDSKCSLLNIYAAGRRSAFGQRSLTRGLKMKAFLAAIGAGAALAYSPSAMALVMGDYTFNFSGNCVDCAEAAETDFYPVTATLMVQNYELGTPFELDNFVQFDYGGSNLVGPFSVTTSSIVDTFYGAIGAAPGSYEVYLHHSGYAYFQTGTDGTWDLGDDFVSSLDQGNIGVWSLTQPGGVPEPTTWMTMILGFGLIGGAMRSRKSQQARVRFAF